MEYLAATKPAPSQNAPSFGGTGYRPTWNCAADPVQVAYCNCCRQNGRFCQGGTDISRSEELPMQTVTTIGVDIASRCFRSMAIDVTAQVIVRRQLKRRYILAFF
jgi:hypothetical protein